MARLYAHRGAAVERPENTMPAFELALEVGADALETDVHVTRDGVVIVSHDDNALRMTGTDAPFGNMSSHDVAKLDAGATFRDQGGGTPYAGKGIGVPTLSQLLAHFPDIIINVDIKPIGNDAVDAVLAVVRAAGAEERVQLASFSWRNLRHARQSYESP